MELQEKIEALFAKTEFEPADREVYEEFKLALRRGEIRSAEKDAEGNWHANAWVKQGILLGFRMGKMVEMSLTERDRAVLRQRHVSLRPMSLEDGVRIVIEWFGDRDGSYVAPGVVVVPPAVHKRRCLC